MLLITAVKMVHSKSPIFRDMFKHFNWYLVDNACNVTFQFLSSNWLGHVDFGLHVTPKKKT